RPDYLKANSEITCETDDIMLNFHVFFQITLSYEGTLLKQFHIVVCPLRIKYDERYRGFIGMLTEQTWHPTMKTYGIKNGEILLTDKRGSSILLNHRLNEAQKNYELYRNSCALMSINLKLFALRLIYERIQGDGLSDSKLKSPHCPF